MRRFIVLAPGFLRAKIGRVTGRLCVQCVRHNTGGCACQSGDSSRWPRSRSAQTLPAPALFLQRPSRARIGKVLRAHEAACTVGLFLRADGFALRAETWETARA